MKAYTQLIEGKVMLSKLPKPEEKERRFNDSIFSGGTKFNKFTFDSAMREFNDSIIGKAENARIRYEKVFVK